MPAVGYPERISAGLLCKGGFPGILAIFRNNYRCTGYGHAVGIFNRLHGGKCIATAFGVLAALVPETWIVLLLRGLYVVSCIVMKGQSMRIRSQSVFFLFGLSSVVYFILIDNAAFAIGCGLIAAAAVYRHRKKENPVLKDVSATCVEKS